MALGGGEEGLPGPTAWPLGGSRAFPILLSLGRQTGLHHLLGVLYAEQECTHNYTANTLPADESIYNPPLLRLPSNLYLLLFVLAL